MKNNLERWNYYMHQLNQKAEVFINEFCSNIPDVFFTISSDGKSIYECCVEKVYYHFGLHYKGKKPSSADIQIIEYFFNFNSHFDFNKIYVDYSYIWSVKDDKANYAKSTIKLNNILNNTIGFLKKEDAESRGLSVLNSNLAKKDFYNKHKKDATFNYDNNGYKFLGWQNDWKHIYYDKDGNITEGNIENGDKPKSSFGYTKSDYPEYGNCVESQHLTIDVTVGRCEHVVSCPICKIYWKYDSSD